MARGEGQGASEGQGATLVIGTAGHIDHGKSALVKALTGTDPDRLKEEQARGITIDLGFAHVSIGDTVVSFVDVPGHERFVRNMLAGAGGFDAVMLVVAANESVMPQTREHFDICRLLGIERGVIALTKTDLVDADTRELSALEVRELVQGSFLERAPILPVSAKTGEGLDALRDALVALARAAAPRGRRDVIRLPVDRVFLVKGFGTVVTGTLVSGDVAVHDELTVLPDGGRVRVRGLQVHGAAASSAAAPRRVALNLGSADAHALHRGVTLTQDGVLGATRRADARIEILASARPLRHGARVRVHHGTSEVLARVSIAAVQSGSDWAAARPEEPAIAVPPGGTAIARLRLETPAVLTRGDRVVLRAYSPPRTIGGGVILDPEPPRGGLRKRLGSDLLFAFLTTTDSKKQKADLTPAAEVVKSFLADARLRGVDALTLVRRAGLGRAEADETMATLVGLGAAVRAGDRVVDARLVELASAAVEAALASFHRAHPDETGMPRESLREQTMVDATPELFDEVIRRLAGRGRVTAGERVALTEHRPPVTQEETAARRAIEAALKASGLTPPDAASLAAQTAVAPSVLDKVMKQLVKEKRLIKIGEFVFHPDALDRLKGEIKAMKSGGAPPPSIDVAAFKDRYGLSRKFAIPLLEWLDRERVTRRVGDTRVVL